MAAVAPLPLRELKAQMVLKHLSVKDVSLGSGVPYTTTSEILNGAQVRPSSLDKIRRFINRSAMPKEAQQ